LSQEENDGHTPEVICSQTLAKWQEDWRFFATQETITVSEVNGSFQGMHLPRKVMDKIFYQNALMWYKPRFKLAR
jgi:hypothetical protein